MLRRLGAAIAVCLMSVGVAVASPGVAAAATTWNLGGTETGSRGGLIWHNRSVGVQGSVWDLGSGYTQVRFRPYVGGTPLYAREQTRTVTEGTRSFNFTLDGSDISGGITAVNVRRCWHESAEPQACDDITLDRP